MILANAYHLALRPGVEVIAELGVSTGSWAGTGPCSRQRRLPDLSLAPLRKVTDAGVEFRSHLDGAEDLPDS